MKYHHRLLEKKLSSFRKAFPCVFLAGARQAGKSTLLHHLFGATHQTFVFDAVQDIYGARQDPDLFLRNNPPPLILDEIQYVPELVPALKRSIDQDRTPGRFLITGSHQWEVMKHLAESLAGRVAILELSGFALPEKPRPTRACWLNAWLEGAAEGMAEGLKKLAGWTSQGLSATEAIWRGSFPEVQALDEAVVPGWMQGYVATYLQRDVRQLLEVRDEAQFATFIALCAALTGQECNYAQLGRDVGLSSPAARRWLSVLRATFQWLEVPAFSTNLVKRLSGKPKGYLADTGLAAYLLRLSSPRAVQGHPSFGALFEALVVTECHKQLQCLPLVPALHHYRQHSGTEIDLLAEYDGRLFPIEVKASSHAQPKDARGIHVFQEHLGPAAGPGLVVYAGEDVLKLSDHCAAVPFDLMPPETRRTAASGS